MGILVPRRLRVVQRIARMKLPSGEEGRSEPYSTCQTLISLIREIMGEIL